MYVIIRHRRHAQCPRASLLLSKSTSRLLLKIAPRLTRRMRLYMIIKLLARELALADFSLILVCRNAMLLNRIAVAIFNGLGGFVPIIERLIAGL